MIPTEDQAIKALGDKLGEERFDSLMNGGTGRLDKLDAFAEAIALIYDTPIHTTKDRLEEIACDKHNAMLVALRCHM